MSNFQSQQGSNLRVYYLQANFNFKFKNNYGNLLLTHIVDLKELDIFWIEDYWNELNNNT